MNNRELMIRRLDRIIKTNPTEQQGALVWEAEYVVEGDYVTATIYVPADRAPQVEVMQPFWAGGVRSVTINDRTGQIVYAFLGLHRAEGDVEWRERIIPKGILHLPPGISPQALKDLMQRDGKN